MKHVGKALQGLANLMTFSKPALARMNTWIESVEGDVKEFLVDISTPADVNATIDLVARDPATNIATIVTALIAGLDNEDLILTVERNADVDALIDELNRLRDGQRYYDTNLHTMGTSNAVRSVSYMWGGVCVWTHNLIVPK